jgi:hypothetical protein
MNILGQLQKPSLCRVESSHFDRALQNSVHKVETFPLKCFPSKELGRSNGGCDLLNNEFD